MAVERAESRPDGTSLSDPAAHAIGAEAPPGRGELLSLMERLRDELNAFLDDVEVRRESSRNRDSSRGL
jgi:hypothetical protein